MQCIWYPKISQNATKVSLKRLSNHLNTLEIPLKSAKTPLETPGFLQKPVTLLKPVETPRHHLKTSSSIPWIYGNLNPHVTPLKYSEGLQQSLGAPLKPPAIPLIPPISLNALETPLKPNRPYRSPAIFLEILWTFLYLLERSLIARETPPWNHFNIHEDLMRLSNKEDEQPVIENVDFGSEQ